VLLKKKVVCQSEVGRGIYIRKIAVCKNTTDLVEMLLQLFIGKIDAKLLKAEKKYIEISRPLTILQKKKSFCKP
jgi:site-specific recombinase